MYRIFLLAILINFSCFAQTNKFTGTWSNENCKNCKNNTILIINIAQSFGKIYGSAEIIDKENNQNIDSLEISGYVNREKAVVSFKSKSGETFSAIMFANETNLQFNRRKGSDLLPKEAILEKLY